MTNRTIATLLAVAAFSVAPLAGAQVTELTATLDTAQVVSEFQSQPPLAEGTPMDAAGSADLSYDASTKTLTWNITYSGLSGAATALHFHGPAGLGETADVQLDIAAISGLASPSAGNAVLTDEQATMVLDGKLYINLHTALNENGEIRGQVLAPSDPGPGPGPGPADGITLTSALDQAQEIPTPTTVEGAMGSAQLSYAEATKTLTWSITFEGLSGAAMMMHFHAPAAAGATADVELDIGAVSGLTSPSEGSEVLTDAQAADLLAGLWYINLHTAANMDGEIRGQVIKTVTFADGFEDAGS